MNPQWLIAAGGLIFFILGVLHLRLTVRDLKEPRAFVPAKRALLDELKATRINLRRDVKDFWTSYLGFHMSHSVGIIFFGIATIYFGLVRPDIFADLYVRLAMVIFGAAYVLMARTFWFSIPFIGALLGTSAIAIGLAMLY